MSNLGKYQKIVEDACKAGGVDKYLKSVESRGAKKAGIAIAAGVGLVLGVNKVFETEIKLSTKKFVRFLKRIERGKG